MAYLSGHKGLFCKDCSVEIFCDINMVMLKDKLWESVCDNTNDSYCDCCIEKKMGRLIKPIDLDGYPDNLALCTIWWLEEIMKTSNAIRGELV